MSATIFWSAAILPLPQQARAETALNRAVVQKLNNLVQLIRQNNAAHPARVSDTMTPGDALSTGRSSLAELRFNDGSLARVGEQAIFRFMPKTRNFRLSNGTLLLLVPPGRGTTDVWTPNATAAIRGSALFLRYIPETATTVVGALTNSNIEVSNQGASQRQVLQAGEMAVIIKDRIEALYKFDLKTFYETSDLVQGLDLNKKSGVATDRAIAQVQAETSAALAAQSPIPNAEAIVNPTFVRRSNTNQSSVETISGAKNDSNFNSITEFINNSETIFDLNNQKPSPSNTEPPASVPPVSNQPPETNNNNNGSTNQPEVNSGASSGSTEQANQGNNGIGNGVGGGQENNPGNGNNSNNGIGAGVGGGGVNNSVNGNGNGNGGANNSGN
ncbi:MAG TPA: FecR domain-containing protein [Leptolyngbyaceae cyanobacterium]